MQNWEWQDCCEEVILLHGNYGQLSANNSEIGGLGRWLTLNWELEHFKIQIVMTEMDSILRELPP